MVIIGAGGFGREVLAIVRAAVAHGTPWAFEGFADDAPSESARDRLAALGTRHLGSITELAARRARFRAVIAVGDPSTRMDIAARLTGAPVEFPVIVHPHATVAPDVVLGAGSLVAPGARISTNVTIGRHVHIDQNVTVGHDTVLGDFVRLNPQACVSGAVDVGRGALVGANATVLQGRRLGEFCVVAAAACVVRDVPTRAVVRGVPAT